MRLSLRKCGQNIIEFIPDTELKRSKQKICIFSIVKTSQNLFCCINYTDAASHKQHIDHI